MLKISNKFKDIHIIEKKSSIVINVLGYENREKHPIYVSKKCCQENHFHLLLIDEKGKSHYILMKDFNTSMHNYTLHRRKNFFIVIVYRLLVQKKY